MFAGGGDGNFKADLPLVISTIETSVPSLDLFMQ